MKLIFCLVSLLAFGLGQSQEAFNIQSNMLANYEQGNSGEVAISVRLTDEASSLEQAVIFLNVVENVANYPQAAHKIFASASETPELFQQVYSAEALRVGVNTSLAFQLKDNAKLSNYSLVIQVFEGNTVDPHKVNFEDRVAIKGFNFNIIAP